MTLFEGGTPLNPSTIPVWFWKVVPKWNVLRYHGNPVVGIVIYFDEWNRVWPINYKYNKKILISIFTWRTDTRNKNGEEALKLNENSGGAVQALVAKNLIEIGQG